MGQVMTRHGGNCEDPFYLAFRVIPQVSKHHPLGLLMWCGVMVVRMGLRRVADRARVNACQTRMID